MITGIDELKTLIKQMPYKCKCKFDGRTRNSNQNLNNEKYQCECQNSQEHHVCVKYHISNPITCAYENGKY